MTIFRAFTNRSFALLWSGQTVSCLGDSLFTIALAWWVLQKTGSATAMSVVLVCSMLPMLLCLLFGGVAVDRFPRIRLMLLSDLLRGGLVLLLALLAELQVLELWQICVLSAVFGVVDAFFLPAYRAIIPDLVPSELRSRANSLTSLSRQGMSFIGPAIGAWIIAFGGTPLSFALDGVSFLLSAICLIVLPPAPALSLPTEREEDVLLEIRKGITTVLHDPWLWVTLVIASVSTIFLVGPTEAALPLLVKQRFAAQVGVFALFTALAALGSVIAAFALGHVNQLRRRGPLTYGMWLLASLMVVVMGLPLPVIGISAAFFIQGAASEILGQAWLNTLQEFVPADLQGRISSIDYLVSFALTPIGYALAGIAADRLGTSLVFITGGAIAAGVIVLGFLHPRVRAID
jgi:MFS family permease